MPVSRKHFSLMSLTRVRWRLSLTLLCLFASTFQSSLALAHIHSGADGEAYVAGAVHASALTSAQQPDHAPNPSGVARESGAWPFCPKTEGHNTDLHSQ